MDTYLGNVINTLALIFLEIFGKFQQQQKKIQMKPKTKKKFTIFFFFDEIQIRISGLIPNPRFSKTNSKEIMVFFFHRENRLKFPP